MTLLQRLSVLLFLLLAWPHSALGQANPVTLRGAGSTLAAPLYVAVGEQLGARHRYALDYQAVGSGEGVRLLYERSVDFGATDRPLARKDLEERELIQVPTAIGGVVLTANLPRVKVGALRLDGATLVDIYLGRITLWNDARLVALNPGAGLPALPITPVVREESSGTTFLFTSYLQRAGNAWGSAPASTIKVPRGEAARGNGGVAKAVLARPGAIGYLEYAYAAENQLPTLQLRNKFSTWVDASVDSIGASVRAADWEQLFIQTRPTFELDVIDAGCPRCWPIVGLTYVVASTRWSDAAKREAFVRFVESLYGSDAEGVKQQERYVPLPSRARNLARVTLRAQMKHAGAAPRR